MRSELRSSLVGRHHSERRPVDRLERGLSVAPDEHEIVDREGLDAAQCLLRNICGHHERELPRHEIIVVSHPAGAYLKIDSQTAIQITENC